MICYLTIARYPKWLGFIGVLSMAIFRLPLWLNKRIGFHKLLGCGRNGTFDKTPDWRQWGLLILPAVNTAEKTDSLTAIPSFIKAWWKFFHCETWTIVLEPLEGHGSWDGKECFGKLPRQSDYEGMIAVLTRATIRLNRLQNFWKHVDPVAKRMSATPGFITSVGIGEIPWIKQATFSLWESKAAMKQFAYQMKEHAEVIAKTRKENWYSEEMFVRFKPIASAGSLNGTNPLKGKL